MSKILLLCTPGLGFLDNALPVVNKIKSTNQVDILIMRGLYKQFKYNPELRKLTDNNFRKKYILGFFNTIFEVKNIESNMFQIFYKSLINIIINLLNILNKKNYISFLNKYDFFFYDIYENHKEYFNFFSKFLENKKKISMRHGLGIDHKQYNKKLLIKNTILLSYSRFQSEFYEKDLDKRSDYKIIEIGIPKHESEWKNNFEDLIKIQNLPKKNFVFFISRHGDAKYLPIKKKEKLIHMVKNEILDKGIKIILKLHPKEQLKKNFEIYKKILGIDQFNKSWFLSDLHPFTLSKHCSYSISFFSSVCLDVISYNKINIELLNINTGEGEIPDFSFKNYNLTHFVNTEEEFKSFVKNFELNKNEIVTKIKKNYNFVYSDDNYDKSLAILKTLL